MRKSYFCVTFKPRLPSPSPTNTRPLSRHKYPQPSRHKHPQYPPERQQKNQQLQLQTTNQLKLQTTNLAKVQESNFVLGALVVQRKRVVNGWAPDLIRKQGGVRTLMSNLIAQMNVGHAVSMPARTLINFGFYGGRKTN